MIQFSDVIREHAQGDGAFSVRSIDLQRLGRHASPVVVLDNFRVRGRPFPPHPHAGFSAVTYVFEDSEGDLRSRDSLGNDYITAPGGIVWTQAGSGVIHEEVPARSERELHGLQIFVNLSSKNKLSAPRVFRLTKEQVPEWRENGDRVRVVVGSFKDVSSPLVPAEAFTLLDVQLKSEVSFNLRESHNALVYVLDGAVLIHTDNREQRIAAQHALALSGGSGIVRLRAESDAQLFVLSGAEIREPVVEGGSFIMNEPSQIDDAIRRYGDGEMGRLPPLN